MIYMLSGNKGEWSELYVFFKLLADGKLYGADSDINILENIYFDILSIYRREKEGTYTYSPQNTTDSVKIQLPNEQLEIPTAEFLAYANIILEQIKNHKTGSLQIDTVSKFAERIKVNGLKAPSQSKADIEMKVYDYRTAYEPEFSFSIKSQLGSPATLLNASRATQFVYRLKGVVTKELIESFNAEKNFRKKFQILSDHQIEVCYHKMANEQFYNTLIMMDSHLPQIIAEYMIERFYCGEKTLQNITPYVSAKNKLGVAHQNLDLYYSYKWKEFLTNVALGVRPNTVWDGQYEATGGYIVVKEQGEVLCYHIYNRNEFRDYLYKNIYFENPSTTRYNYGQIYEQDDEYYLDLNLQLRFLK